MTVNTQINPSSSEDWELIAEVYQSKPASLTQIPRFDLGIELNADFIAVEVVPSNAKSTWASAGFLSQVYQFAEFELTSTQYFIALNQINLIRLNRPAPTSYRLVYNPLKYFVDVTVKVWQYNGISTDLLLQDIARTLQNVPLTAEVDLSLINAKLDSILQDRASSVNVDLSEVNSKLDAILSLLGNGNTEDRSSSDSYRQKFFMFN